MERFVHRGFVHPGGVSPVKQDEELYLQDPGIAGTPDRETQVKKKAKEIEKEESMTLAEKELRKAKQRVSRSASEDWGWSDWLGGVGTIGSFFTPAGDVAVAGTEVAEGKYLSALGTLGLGILPGSSKMWKGVFGGGKKTKQAKKAKKAQEDLIKKNNPNSNVTTQKVAMNPKETRTLDLGINKPKGGVDVADDVHFKSTTKRTVPVRGGKAFDDPMGEYSSMKSMYDQFPDHVVKPLNPVFDDAGKLTGYNMEKVEGVNMMQWMDEGNTLSKEMYDDIATTITEMNKKGIYHGDLKINNIMIDATGNWKLIDPVGFNHASNMTDEMLKVAQKSDGKALENLSKLIEK